MRIRNASAYLSLAAAILLCSACGGGAPHSQSADLLALRQPTPDPTLDAVVRDLPRALAGVAPTATPVPRPATVVRQPPPSTAKPAPQVRQTAPPTAKPTPPRPTPTPTRH